METGAHSGVDERAMARDGSDGSGRNRRAVFLDRDGTVLEEREYLADPDRVSLIPGAAEAIRSLRRAGLAVIITTNQSGIARGLYSEGEYRAVEERLARVLAEEEAPVDATYYCPHHPDFTGPCDCRKPATGMFRRAARELDLDLEGSFYVGDRLKDVMPALILGGKGILVRTGYGREQESLAPDSVVRVDDVTAAAGVVLQALDREGEDS